MQVLSRLDLELFRFLNLGLRSALLDFPMLLFTASGLGQVQFTALLSIGWISPRWRLAFAALSYALVGLLAARAGDPWAPQVMAGGLLCALFLGLEPREARFSLACAVLAGALRLPLAGWIGRVRPSNFEFARVMEPVYGATSFPSGHATTSFAIAFGLLLAVRQRRWIAHVALGWAIMVGISRSYVGVHFPSDVLGGAALGLFSAALICLAAQVRSALQARGSGHASIS